MSNLIDSLNQLTTNLGNAMVQASNTPAKQQILEATPVTQGPSSADFFKWAGAFVVFSMIMLALAESEDYGEIASALTWLIAASAFFYWFDPLDRGLADLIGTPPG